MQSGQKIKIRHPKYTKEEISNYCLPTTLRWLFVKIKENFPSPNFSLETNSVARVRGCQNEHE